MSRLTALVLRHRLAVLLAWIALAAAGAATAGLTTGRLASSFALPGSASDDATHVLAERYGIAAEDPAVLVVQAPTDLRADPGRAALARITVAATTAGGPAAGVRAVPGPTPADTRSAVVLLLPPARAGGRADGTAATAAAVTAARTAAPPGWQVRATGTAELAGAGAPGGAGVLAETVIGATGALVVLAVVFAGPLALVPLLVAAVSILTTFLALLGLTVLTPVNGIAQFLIALIGLGVAIDYSLLVITRWREERAHGAGNRDAVLIANRVAGRAVVLSGTTVTVGLLALVLLPMPAMRSFGYAGALIPLVSVGVAVTLLPIVLDAAGPALDRLRIRVPRRAAPGPAPVPARDGAAGWSRWARLVLRHRWWALAAGATALALLAAPALDLQPGDTRVSALATSGPARDGLDALLAAGAPVGTLTPVHVLADAAVAGPVADRLRALPGVTAVLPAPADTAGPAAGVRLLEVVPRAEEGTGAGRDTVRAIRDAVAREPGVRAVGGSGTGAVDFLDRVYGSFPLLLAVVCAVTFLLLLRAFRSVLLAAKAVALNLASLAAAYGVLVTVWQHGHGSDLLWGTPGTGSIAAWVPIMVFSFLFGLSMDYEVFLLARMREAHDAGASTDDAVVTGIGVTGRLVTSAALILFLAFLSMSAAPVTDVRVLATGLGAGILIDATLVRCLLVPTLVGVLGNANWWVPRPLARVLAVPPSGGRPVVPGPPVAASVD